VIHYVRQALKDKTVLARARELAKGITADMEMLLKSRQAQPPTPSNTQKQSKSDRKSSVPNRLKASRSRGKSGRAAKGAGDRKSR